MDGKIFSFDLQRFDNVWSIGSDSSSYVYGPGATSFASLKVAGTDSAKFWSLGGGSSDAITLNLSQTDGANSVVGKILDSMTGASAWIFDASKVTGTGGFSFTLASNTPFTSIAGAASSANTIDASKVNSGNLSITGGTGADLLKAGSSGKFYLNGGTSGADTFVGGKGTDYFIFDGGENHTASIQSYGSGDFISLTSGAALPGAASVKAVNDGKDLALYFGTNGANSLLVEGASAKDSVVTVLKDNAIYYYSKDAIATGDYTSVSLTSNGSRTFTALSGNFSTKAVTIDARAASVESGVKVTLNNKGDYFIGSSKGNSITDGTGADFISLDEGTDIFYYKGGADSIVGFDTGDSVSLSSSNLSFVKDGTKLESLEGQAGFKLTFGTGNTLTFTDVAANKAVSVYGSGSTTPYEYTSTAISLKGSSNDSVTLGSSYDSESFDGSNFTFINAAAVSQPGTFSIQGGDSASYIYGSDNVLTSITGGTGNDTLKAGTAGAILSGGESSNDLLIGSAKADSFLYVGGADSITSYSYSGDYEDVVSLTGESLKLPMTFDTTQSAHANYKGSDYVVSLGGSNSLTFKSKQQFALAQGDSTYTYTHNSIALDNDNDSEHGITIGGSYYTSKTFNGASEANSKFVSINASEVNHAIRVTGNDEANYMVASSLYGGTLLGGDKNDTLQAGSVGAYMDGGDGDVLYIGSTDKTATIGADTFVYRGNAASIQNYNAGDIVNFSASDLTINGASVSSASLGTNAFNISLNFGGSDAIYFQSLTSDQATKGVSLKSGRSNLYVYKKDSVTWNDKSITLTADYTGDSLFSATTADKASLVTINAELVGTKIGTATFSIAGNAHDNYIIGSTIKSNSISGGAGNDTLVGNAASLDVFHYTAGKDVILGFDTLDNFSISSADLDSIKTAKASRNNLTFTIDNTNTIAFRSNDSADVPTMVSLSGDDVGYLTKDGVVSKNDDKYSLKLFSNAKGTIDLTDTALYGNTTITSLNATLAAKQGLTVIAKKVDGDAYYNFAPNNKKRDTFEYGGGAVSITGFESGKDRLNISSDTITSFSISGDTVVISLNADGSGDAVSLSGAKGNEILVRANGARGYSKMVFKDAGVLENRTKNPTSVTLSTGAASYSAENSTVKKITVTDIDKSISIYAGAKGSIVDASGSTNYGVSLIGGAKADKFTGSNYTDVFFYDTSNGGKDIINSFVTGDTAADSIKFGRDGSGSASLLSDAKISAGNKAIKFKFANKDVLTVKGDSMKDAKLQIAGTKYSYSKNALVDEANVSLTSAFGGTYKVANGVNYVDGHLSEKNLTFKVTSAGTDETLIGGKKKTTFKGAGGTDSLVGGTGDDVFFYARGDNGTATIANFDIDNDKLKIAGGTLRNITVSGSGELTFNMSAKNSKDDPEIGHFNIQSFYNKDTKQTETLDATNKKANNTLIHTNGTYYWFATNNVTEEVTTEGGDGSTVTLAKAGDLITWSDKKVTSSLIKDYDVIELNYGTNLVKSGVATLVSSKATNADLPNK